MMRTVRCGCGGLMAADTRDSIDVMTAVQRHHREVRHVRWALIEYPAPPPAPEPTAEPPLGDVSQVAAGASTPAQSMEPSTGMG